jgi:hypothetical protein
LAARDPDDWEGNVPPSAEEKDRTSPDHMLEREEDRDERWGSRGEAGHSSNLSFWGDVGLPSTLPFWGD